MWYLFQREVKTKQKKDVLIMTNENNELMVNTDTGEIMDNQVQPNEQIVQDTPEYKIVQLSDGTFKKNMKYKQYFSRKAETDEEKVELYKVFNGQDDELVTPLKNMVKKEITVKHLFTQPYQSFDETTGVSTDGVTTTIEDIDGNYYATSSKSVYYTLQNLTDTFGRPTDENYKPIKVLVTGTKRTNGIQIDLELIGTV